MSMKKINGFQNWFIHEALTAYVIRAEKEVKENENKTIFAPGYWTHVGKECKQAIDALTIKSHLKERQNEQS